MPLNASEIMEHNVKLLSPYIAPILVYKHGEQDASKWLTGGSVFLAKTVDNSFLVTADHVVREIESLRAQGPILVVLAGPGSEPIDITEWPVIARDKDIDICILQVPSDFDASSIAKELFELRNWPHRQAEIGDKALIMGYPSLHREGTRNTVRIKITPISDFVTDVGPRRFTMADETDEREVLLNPNGIEIPAHFGGMSGSPVFRMIEGARPEFIGVFSEGGDGLSAALFCAHASFILASGGLDYSMLPPR